MHWTKRILARADAKRIARAICVAALVLWIAALVEAYLGPLHAGLYWLSGHISPEMGKLYIGESDNLFLLLFIFIVSPITILALALGEQVLGASWQRLSFLGDISYSTYLLHFPMQLALALIAAHFALTPSFFENPAGARPFLRRADRARASVVQFLRASDAEPVAQKRHVADR